MDHYGLDPRHGSPGDFVEFTQQARQRGIRVIMSLPPFGCRWYRVGPLLGVTTRQPA